MPNTNFNYLVCNLYGDRIYIDHIEVVNGVNYRKIQYLSNHMTCVKDMLGLATKLKVKPFDTFISRNAFEKTGQDESMLSRLKINLVDAGDSINFIKELRHAES